jgi:hypothetical protein
MASNLFFRPIEGTFDIALIREYLDGQPDAVEDPHGTAFYLVCGSPESVQNRWQKRKDDPSRFPRCGLIEVTPNQVTLVQESADDDELRSALAFAKWMWNHFSAKIHDHYDRDVTEEIRRDGIESLYPDWVRGMPAPWADRLIKVGFFRELDHGDSGGPSLEESRAETPGPDEDRTAAYMESGHLLSSSLDVAKDWLSDDPDVEIGPPHIFTDGTYAWPADLAYYVRNYHVRLPKHFVKHIQRNEFRIPVRGDMANLKIE